MNTKHLVDPELVKVLEQIPTIEPTAASLPELRSSLAEFKSSAPPAPRTAAEERFIPGPDGCSVRVLVYSPDAPTHAGALLWLHAGGMIMGDPDVYEAQSRFIAQESGCVVVAVEYRLAPENPYPAGLEDCYAALRWMHTAADELHIPRERIAISGESGGGGLAAGLALMARDRGELPISAQFLLYPMLDDRTGTSVEPDPMPYAGEFVWTRASNQFAWSSVLGQKPGSANVSVYAAPGRAIELAGLPPTFLLVGGLDLFIEENLRFARTLIRDGVTTELHVYPGAFHGFVSFGSEASVAERAQREFWSAIRRHFHGSDPH